ncbi:MAG: SGNH/GDSL hydrolase family protein [Clostridia bacterium]|nr:SGNH/GDSL hydrolase family protein [Clostridia bacterium]
MKKKLTTLFLVLLILSTFAFMMNSLVGSATTDTGRLTFDGFTVGAVSEARTYNGDNYFSNISKMGNGVSYEIVEDGGVKVYRTTSLSDSAAGGHYIGLKNITAGRYSFALTLRFSDGATLPTGKILNTRLDSESYTDTQIDTLYEQASLNADGFKTITYELDLVKSHTKLRLYNRFKTGGYIDLKEITITKLADPEPPSTNGEIAFDGEEGALTEITYTDNMVSKITDYGTGGSANIVKDSETFVKLTATGDKFIGINGYFSLNALEVNATYDFKIALRIGSNDSNGQFKIQEGGRFAFRLYNSTTVQQEVVLTEEYYDMDITTWQTVAFKIKTNTSYTNFHLFMYGTENSFIDIKSISITKGEEDETPTIETPAPETEGELLFNLSDYTIVYGEYEAEHLMEKYTKAASFTEWDFNRLIAEELKDNIKNTFGVTLPIVKDTESQITDKEILIGNTNRKDYQGYLGLTFVKDLTFIPEGESYAGAVNNFEYSKVDPFKYAYGVQGNDIYIVGGCPATTYSASNYFFEYLKKNLTDNKTTITASWKKVGTEDIEVIGCIGDSITHGVKADAYDRGTVDTYSYFSYPAYLQRLNWKTTYVYNFGYTGRTMRSDCDKNYQKASRWTKAKEMIEVLDTVVISLGANDTYVFDPNNGYHAWNDNDKQAFYDSFFEIIDTINDKNKEVNYLFVNCTKSLRTQPTGCQDFILPIQAKCVELAKARGYNIELFDMRALNEEKIPSSLYGDYTHFTSEGYFIMANGINEALKVETPIPDAPSTPDDKGGCGSVITVGNVILSMVLLAGSVIVLKKKD